MPFDAHNHAFRVLDGVLRHGVYDNLWMSPAQGDPLASAAGMHESIRPVAGRLCENQWAHRPLRLLRP
jgi:hypothetical protein